MIGKLSTALAKKTSARLRDLATVLGVSSRNLADVFLTNAVDDRGNAVFPEPKWGPHRVPEYKFSHIVKLLLIQLWAPTTHGSSGDP